jgi:hypothetical protein
VPQPIRATGGGGIARIQARLVARLHLAKIGAKLTELNDKQLR